jgi:hypothetical protein
MLAHRAAEHISLAVCRLVEPCSRSINSHWKPQLAAMCAMAVVRECVTTSPAATLFASTSAFNMSGAMASRLIGVRGYDKRLVRLVLSRTLATEQPASARARISNDRFSSVVSFVTNSHDIAWQRLRPKRTS